jgi:hypothetical protein
MKRYIRQILAIAAIIAAFGAAYIFTMVSSPLYTANIDAAMWVYFAGIIAIPSLVIATGLRVFYSAARWVVVA